MATVYGCILIFGEAAGRCLVLEQENGRPKKLWLDMMMMDCSGSDKQASNMNLEHFYR